MHDVNAHRLPLRGLLAAEFDQQRDCGQFGFIGARGEVGGIAAPVRRAQACGRHSERSGQLGMNEQRQAGLRDQRQRMAQVGFVDQAKAVAAGVDQEAFETRDTCLCERDEVELIVVFRSSPGSPVHAALPGCGGAFGFEPGDRCRRGQAVERHIDQRGDAARGGGASCAGETLPIRAPGSFT